MKEREGVAQDPQHGEGALEETVGQDCQAVAGGGLGL